MGKKRQGSGRVTAKGTQSPGKKPRASRSEFPVPPSAPHAELRGKVGKQQGKVARPITHNRGNR